MVVNRRILREATVCNGSIYGYTSIVMIIVFYVVVNIFAYNIAKTGEIIMNRSGG